MLYTGVDIISYALNHPNGYSNLPWKKPAAFTTRVSARRGAEVRGVFSAGSLRNDIVGSLKFIVTNFAPFESLVQRAQVSGLLNFLWASPVLRTVRVRIAACAGERL